jgi:hypothetical protein
MSASSAFEMKLAQSFENPMKAIPVKKKSSSPKHSVKLNINFMLMKNKNVADTKLCALPTSLVCGQKENKFI